LARIVLHGCLTFALSGAPREKLAKDAPLVGASALEREVRRIVLM
jgi:hypothetical protein